MASPLIRGVALDTWRRPTSRGYPVAADLDRQVAPCIIGPTGWHLTRTTCRTPDRVRQPLYQGRPLKTPLLEVLCGERNGAFAMPFWSVRCMPFIGLARVGVVVSVLSGDRS